MFISKRLSLLWHFAWFKSIVHICLFLRCFANMVTLLHVLLSFMTPLALLCCSIRNTEGWIIRFGDLKKKFSFTKILHQSWNKIIKTENLSFRIHRSVIKWFQRQMQGNTLNCHAETVNIYNLYPAYFKRCWELILNSWIFL